MKSIWWYIRGHFVYHSRDWWYENFEWTGVHLKEMPDRYISKWEFWVKYSPINSC